MELKRLNKYENAQCACCGYYTIREIAETCPVCYWEENIYQEENQDDNDAPNYISLKEAKENFLKFGATTSESKNLTRKPHPEELEQS
jgi:Cysteine-rich CPCC